MPERDGYIPGVPCWVDVSEPDPEAAVDFYGGLFSWEFEDVMPPSSEGKYFIARHEAASSSIFDVSGARRRGDVAAVRSILEAAPPTAMWNTYFWVDSADEAASKVRDAGGSVLMEPFDFMDACRMAVFTDPEGSVFGWQTGVIGGEAEGWTLPGYGDWLEREHHPELRSRMTEAGAPEGFEDVVASIIPIADEQPDTPAHWSVTFATDDADATGKKATELGAPVIVPPFD